MRRLWKWLVSAFSALNAEPDPAIAERFRRRRALQDALLPVGLPEPYRTTIINHQWEKDRLRRQIEEDPDLPCEAGPSIGEAA